MNNPQEHTVDYWLRKLQLWSILHPNIREKHMLCGANNDCPHMNIKGMNCTIGMKIPRIYVTADFKHGIFLTGEQNADRLVHVKTYCMEWIKYE